MDLYAHTQGSILKKLLAKRQHPIGQISNSSLKSVTNPLSHLSKSHLPCTLNTPNISRKTSEDQSVYLTGVHTPSVHTSKEDSTGESDVEGRPPLQQRKRRNTENCEEIHNELKVNVTRMSKSPALQPRSSGFLSETESPEFGPVKVPVANVSKFKFRPTNLSRKRSEDATSNRIEEESSEEELPQCSNSDSLVDARMIAANYGGALLGECNGIFSLRCALNHRFTLNCSEIETSWCPTCSNMLKVLQNELASRGDRVLNDFYALKLEITCRNGHKWVVDSKLAAKKDCPSCLKARKEENKRRMIEEVNRKMLEDQVLQERLLEEARLKMLASKPKSCADGSNRCLEAFRRYMNEIAPIATSSATKFMEEEKAPEADLQLEALVELYKFDMMPEEILVNYFKNLPEGILKSEYRRMAKTVHPDKMRHPRANFAFQKLGNCYNKAFQQATVGFSQ